MVHPGPGWPRGQRDRNHFEGRASGFCLFFDGLPPPAGDMGGLGAAASPALGCHQAHCHGCPLMTAVQGLAGAGLLQEGRVAPGPLSLAWTPHPQTQRV